MPADTTRPFSGRFTSSPPPGGEAIAVPRAQTTELTAFARRDRVSRGARPGQAGKTRAGFVAVCAKMSKLLRGELTVDRPRRDAEKLRGEALVAPGVAQGRVDHTPLDLLERRAD